MDEKPVAKKSLWEVLSSFNSQTFKSRWSNIKSEMKISEVERALKEVHSVMAHKWSKLGDSETEVNVWTSKEGDGSCESLLKDKIQSTEVEKIMLKNETLTKDLEMLHKEVTELKSAFDNLKKKVYRLPCRRDRN